MEIIEECGKKYDSFYLYDENIIIKSINQLKQNFPGVSFLYSIKCNSNQNVLASIFEQGFGSDAASSTEVLIANSLGVSPKDIYYSAPGKSVQDIEKTIDKAVIIADSISEIKMINQIAKKQHRLVHIGVRVNPNFSYDDNHGYASKFGIDEDQFLDFINNNDLHRLKIVGIHVHLKSQELDTDLLCQYHHKLLEYVDCFQQTNGPLEFINMGSGIGVPYYKDDQEVDLKKLGTNLTNELSTFKTKYPNIKVMIETGRFITCKSGIYVTKVMDRKISHNKTYLILKNTLNGFIRPSIIQMLKHYSSNLASSFEPLFTCDNAFEILTLKENKDLETVTLVGNLCTATDVIADNIQMPHLYPGDLIIITNAGSYASVLSPSQFSSQDKPIELFKTIKGEIK